jgi:hypothetical protein
MEKNTQETPQTSRHQGSVLNQVANHLRLKLIRALVFIPPSRFNLKPSGPIQVSGQLGSLSTLPQHTH